MLHLREKDKQILCDIANEVFEHTVEVWAYGSRVTGESHDGSDLDLVVRQEGLKMVNKNVFLRFKDMIQESNIPILVDLFNWGRLPKSFQENILTKYEVLFVKKSEKK